MKIINVPVILADESLFDIVVIIGKARMIAPRNNRHLAILLYNSSPAKFQAQYDTAAPGRPGYGRVKV